jgi:regulator of RNase E activity RraA
MQESKTSLIERLARLETGQLSDVLDEAGLPRHALASSFQPLGAARRMVGVAVCARGEPHVRSRTPRRPPLPADALDQALGPDSVLLIDTGGFEAGSCLGGFMAYSFQRRGCAGVVVDGTVRDADEIRELGLPTYCRGVTPINGARRWGLVEIGGPIQLRGADGAPLTVQPGDFVVGDADGVVIVPAASAQSIVEDTEELARIERKISEEMKAGEDRGSVFKRNPRFDHVRTIA